MSEPSIIRQSVRSIQDWLAKCRRKEAKRLRAKAAALIREAERLEAMSAEHVI